MTCGLDAFSTLGNTIMVPEAEINAGVVRNADILITRSKVNINDALLDGSRVTFYGTATAGTDHVDAAALERRGIAWAEAAGSNANSVAEYILASLSHLALNHQVDWTGKTMGIIGAGHVGSRLAELAEPFGLKVILNDPPLFDATGIAHYQKLDYLLAHSDIVSLHVPLTNSGAYPTAGMADHAFFAMMKPGAVFINASRGEVVVESALQHAADKRAFLAIVLDVFAHEPDIQIDTLKIAAIGTPHIAGYSYDGRVKGTAMVYQAACRHLGVKPAWKAPLATSTVVLGAIPKQPAPHHLYEFIESAYSPAADDQRLRSLPVGMPMRKHFQKLRQEYPERREFQAYTLTTGDPGSTFATRVKKLGFRI